MSFLAILVYDYWAIGSCLVVYIYTVRALFYKYFVAMKFRWPWIFLSYHQCFICLQSACRVYYSYLQQAIHDKVTSEVNTAKMQMIQKFGWWMMLFGSIDISHNSCCVIKFALFKKERNHFIPVISLSSVSHVYFFILFISRKRK